MSDTFDRSNATAGESQPAVLPGGPGEDTVSASGNVMAFGGSGIMNFLNDGSGSRGVSGALGSVTVFGGAAGNNQLVAGQLPSEPTGAGTGDQLFAGVSADQLAAAGGNETLSGFGTAGNNVYFGGTGGDLVIMGAGAERYVGGQGNDVVASGLGNDAQVLRTVGVSAGNAVLHLPDGTVVTMVGVTHLTGSSTA